MQGIERYHRLLKDHRDPVAAHAAQGRLIRMQQRLAMKTDITAGVAGRRGREQPQHRQGGDALTGAGFAHQGQRFADRHLERQIMHHGLRLALLAKGNREIVDS